jgi:hypothetical protein
VINMRSIHRLASRLSKSSATAARCAAIAALVSCSWFVAGCSSRGSDAVAVAQVAVRANPELELMATDERQAVLTVRIKKTGRVITVRADDVVAGSAFRDLDAGTAKSETPAAPVAATPPAAAPAPPPPSPQPGAARQAEVSTPAARVAVVPPSGESKKRQATVAVEADTSRGVTAETPAATVSVERAPRPAGRSAEAAAPPTTAVPPARPPAAAEGAARSTQSSPAGTTTTLDASSLRRRTDPVQCLGTESIRLDGVLLQADRVAVQAGGKCAVHITNSHVVGSIAVRTLGDATVTIENSVIEGRLQATQTSTISARASTIQGRVTKLQSGAVRDLGQNVWR